MELDAAVQLIALLIAVWSLYVSRRTSQPRRPQKNSAKASITCLWGILKKKSTVLSMLNSPEEKKSGCATGSSSHSKEAHEVHTACSPKKRESDTCRIEGSRKGRRVNKYGQKKSPNIGLPIDSHSVSGIPPKKTRADPFVGFEETLGQTVFGLAKEKTHELGAYA